MFIYTYRKKGFICVFSLVDKCATIGLSMPTTLLIHSPCHRAENNSKRKEIEKESTTELLITQIQPLAHISQTATVKEIIISAVGMRTFTNTTPRKTWLMRPRHCPWAVGKLWESWRNIPCLTSLAKTDSASSMVLMIFNILCSPGETKTHNPLQTLHR